MQCLVHPWLSCNEANEEFTDPFPIGSMYGISTHIWLKFMVNVRKYSIHMDRMDFVGLGISRN